jgi:hypothetical protein
MARHTSAGFRKFMPVPPNTSLENTRPTTVPSATCQSGIVGGRISGISAPVTKNPSLTSCLRSTAKSSSMPSPAAIATA